MPFLHERSIVIYKIVEVFSMFMAIKKFLTVFSFADKIDFGIKTAMFFLKRNAY